MCTGKTYVAKRLLVKQSKLVGSLLLYINKEHCSAKSELDQLFP